MGKTFRTLRTSSSSTPTRRWPSSRALTSHRHWTFFPNNFHFHPFTKFIYNSSNSTPHKQEWPPKNLRGCLWNNGLHAKLLWMPTLLLITTQRGLKQIEPSFKS